jgi:hypothetical protein
MSLIQKKPETPIEVIAVISRVVTKIVDRIAGDRVEVPLMVAAAVKEACEINGIGCQIIYGPAGWVEILNDQTPIWAGCWGNHFHIWAATEFGEVVDLTVGVAHRKRAHDAEHLHAIYSPPLLWAKDVPAFYRYQPEGVAELEIADPEDQRKFQLVLGEVREKCSPEAVLKESESPVFPNEPMLCPGRRVLDDTQETFKKFDRALRVKGMPPAPKL